MKSVSNNSIVNLPPIDCLVKPYQFFIEVRSQTSSELRQLTNYFMQLIKTPFNFIPLSLAVCFVLLLPTQHFGQSLFPIKKNKKWGLINSDGRIVQEPVYDAIGEFKEFGYAIMQRNGWVGMLNDEGQEVVPPQYGDVKALDRSLVSVMDKGVWKVLNMEGKTVLQPGYERVEILKNDNSPVYLAYRLDGKWGLVDVNGETVAEPRFDEITVLQNVPKEVKSLFFSNKKGRCYWAAFAKWKRNTPAYR